MIDAAYLTLIFVLLVVIVFLCKKLYEFSTLILKIEESIEESLDMLQERYRLLNEILQKPIFFDSIEVRTAVEAIKGSHQAILLIANKLTNDIGLTSEIKEKDLPTQK